jgi:1-acyl-sn-glycerol-3-phosphate acyltransferase
VVVARAAEGAGARESMSAAAGGRALLVANHRSRLDWAFLWPALLRGALSAGESGGKRGVLASLRELASLHIIQKSDLRRVPFAGWATSAGR